MLYKKWLSKDDVWQKIQHYCAYQDRCHEEVRQKLYSMGQSTQEVNLLISRLIEENFLNEERFAENFVRGKFNMKQWGRVKIAYALKQKNISAYLVKASLAQIEEAGYEVTLLKLAHQKWTALRSLPNYERMARVTNYLLQKGYELELIKKILHHLPQQVEDI